MSFVKKKRNYLDFSLVISGYSRLLALWAQPDRLTICGPSLQTNTYRLLPCFFPVNATIHMFALCYIL